MLRATTKGVARLELEMYNVQMKKVTPTEARKHWFRLLDEVAAGETVAIDRHGTRLILTRDSTSTPAVPDYGEILRVPDAHEAHRWGWRWEGGDLAFEPGEDSGG